MAFLLLYLGPGRRFDTPAVERALRSSPHATLSDPSGLRCEYRVGDDFTTVRLNPDGETLVIDGMGEASLAAALDIQRGCAEPIRATDDGYSFDLAPTDAESIADLLRRIDAGHA